MEKKRRTRRRRFNKIKEMAKKENCKAKIKKKLDTRTKKRRNESRRSRKCEGQDI